MSPTTRSSHRSPTDNPPSPRKKRRRSSLSIVAFRSNHNRRHQAPNSPESAASSSFSSFSSPPSSTASGSWTSKRRSSFSLEQRLRETDGTHAIGAQRPSTAAGITATSLSREQGNTSQYSRRASAHLLARVPVGSKDHFPQRVDSIPILRTPEIELPPARAVDVNTAGTRARLVDTPPRSPAKGPKGLGIPVESRYSRWGNIAPSRSQDTLYSTGERDIARSTTPLSPAYSSTGSVGGREGDAHPADMSGRRRSISSTNAQPQDLHKGNDAAPGSERFRSQNGDGTEVPRNKEKREADKKTMLSRALQKAHTAVLLDNAQNFEGAIEAYEDAVHLLGQVLYRSAGEDDRKKLDAIVRVTPSVLLSF